LQPNFFNQVQSVAKKTFFLNHLFCINAVSFYSSYDTEALNQPTIENIDSTIFDPSTFEPSFRQTIHNKITYGVQRLYVIGLFDIVQIESILGILQHYLPFKIMRKISKFVTYNPTNPTPQQNLPPLDWSALILTELEHTNTEMCALRLVEYFRTVVPNANCVHTFHIDNNMSDSHSSEPTFKNTRKMIHQFLFYIYQRNIVASLIKFILLRKLLQTFEHCVLTKTKQSIFFVMYQRIKEIVFESILFSFNGANYDNYLLCNDLIIILTKLKEKIQIFKKGASVSTIFINVKKNILPEHPTTNKKKTKSKQNKWPMKLFFKDIRYLLSSHMTLDQVGKLFNLNVSKLCFPYEQATSIKILKTLTSLDPYNDLFWKDTFSGKTVMLEQRLHAQTLYNMHAFKNLYAYGTFYLIQDCHLLHSIVCTLFDSYLTQNINIFLRRNFSQSSLAYQQFFIIDPSKQIDKILAPKVINHSFYNYFIKQSITGGLCTSFVHGNVGVDSDTPINEHLNYLNYPNLNTTTWPNFNNLNQWKNSTHHLKTQPKYTLPTQKCFNELPSGINTIDIRSLYPSASIKKIPVNTPLFFSRFTPETLLQREQNPLKTVFIKNLCDHVQTHGNCTQDSFKLLNKPPKGYYEFQALAFYLSNALPPDCTILRFQSQFTALNQFYFEKYPVDGFLSYRNNTTQKIYIKIIQYNSIYFHGHKETCALNQNNSPHLSDKTKHVTNQILMLIDQYKTMFYRFLVPIDIEYVQLSDCDYFLHKIPKVKPFLFPYKKTYSYSNFLSNILQKKITGFLVVKNLEIKQNNQNPIFGFFIQKIRYGYKNLSPYSQSQLREVANNQRVVSLNKSKSFMVINTEYFVWLYKTFGFEHLPDIYHALCFQLDDYLRSGIEHKLSERKTIKELIALEKNKDIKQTLEIKAELIKLMLNSSYGYTLCNVNSSKFKQFENRRKCPTKNVQANFISAQKIYNNVFLVEVSKQIKTEFQTTLGHVGAYILFQSKKILLKRLYFLLKYLNPTQAQLLYMDTDSAHFLLKNKNFIDNVDENLKLEFKSQFNKHFDTGNKISGIWVQENFFDKAEYIGEKSYVLFNKDNLQYTTHMKGLNSKFQRNFFEQKIQPNITPAISFNNFFKSPDFVIYKTHLSKNIFSNFGPIKRYFVCANGSLPLKL
jgi:hypothetical protein